MIGIFLAAMLAGNTSASPSRMYVLCPKGGFSLADKSIVGDRFKARMLCQQKISHINLLTPNIRRDMPTELWPFPQLAADGIFDLTDEDDLGFDTIHRVLRYKNSEKVCVDIVFKNGDPKGLAEDYWGNYRDFTRMIDFSISKDCSVGYISFGGTVGLFETRTPTALTIHGITFKVRGGG